MNHRLRNPRGGSGSYYFNYSLQDLNKKWSDVKQLVPQRDGTLAAELRKQQSILLFSLGNFSFKIRDIETRVQYAFVGILTICSITFSKDEIS